MMLLGRHSIVAHETSGSVQLQTHTLLLGVL